MIRTPIRKVSAKAAKRFRGRAKAYDQLDHEWEPGYCQGCGQWKSVIDHSHLLSQDDYPHLADNKGNIVPHCRERCHTMWENPTQRWKLLDFRDNMEFIQRVAPREAEKMLGLSALKVEKHYGEEELQKYLEVISEF